MSMKNFLTLPTRKQITFLMGRDSLEIFFFLKNRPLQGEALVALEYWDECETPWETALFFPRQLNLSPTAIQESNLLEIVRSNMGLCCSLTGLLCSVLNDSDSVRQILQRKYDEWDDGAMHADLKSGLTNARTLIEPQRVAFSTSQRFRVRI